MDINKITLLGNVGKEPEIKETRNGGEIMVFSLATNESWKDKQSGEWQTVTEWHNIVIFNEHIINRAKNYLTKGSRVLLEGMKKTRSWETEDGDTRYVTEIVLSGFNCQLIPVGKAEKLGDATSDPYEKPEEKQEKDPFDDDIPW